jgi:hypothetical protein
LFLKHVSTAKARCSTDQRSMATELLWVSLEWRSRTNSPRQQFHLQLCCQMVGYFCRTCISAALSFFKAWHRRCACGTYKERDKKDCISVIMFNFKCFESRWDLIYNEA